MERTPDEEIENALDELGALYDAVPENPGCTSCGRCCMDPHMTLPEFAFLLKSGLAVLDRAERDEILNKPMVKHPEYPGEFVCRFLRDDKTCAVYAGRPLGCRIDGIEALNQHTGREVCPSPLKGPSGDDLDLWIYDLFTISRRIIEMEEPYFLDALNIECWLATMADATITQLPFVRARRMLMPLAEGVLFAGYKDQTRLSEKLALIDAFFAASAIPDAEKALRHIRKVYQEFSKTGEYFAKPAKEYFAFTKDAVKVRRG